MAQRSGVGYYVYSASCLELLGPGEGQVTVVRAGDVVGWNSRIRELEVQVARLTELLQYKDTMEYHKILLEAQLEFDRTRREAGQ